MSLCNRNRAKDLMLRILGLALMALGAMTMRHLFNLVHMPPRHEASSMEMGLAAMGFSSLSVGSALIFLGAHIFDEIEIPARWMRKPKPAEPFRQADYPGALRADTSALSASPKALRHFLKFERGSQQGAPIQFR